VRAGTILRKAFSRGQREGVLTKGCDRDHKKGREGIVGGELTLGLTGIKVVQRILPGGQPRRYGGNGCEEERGE